MHRVILNHNCCKLSELDMLMVKAIPSGGNWKDIPLSIPSKRLDQIRRSGGRTTYYGRLKYDAPAYTISTFFNRPGNGCYIHPDDGRGNRIPQHRLITFREAARLQSFPDNFVFYGPKTSQLKQIGNAVPPLLARAIAECVNEKTFVDLFCGAGGLSLGFLMAGKELVGAIDHDTNACQTFVKNHANGSKALLCGDISNPETRDEFAKIVRRNLGNRRLGIVIGGAPCQGFSLAGNRFTTDPRNKLFIQFVNVVKELNPKMFLFENVPGLLSMQDGRAIATIIKCFEKLGYCVNHPVILKAEQYGVPQKRRRLFLLGQKKGISAPVFPPPPLFGTETLLKLQPVTVRDAISDLPQIYEGLGDSEYIMTNWQPQSSYQKFMAGLIDFHNFHITCRENTSNMNKVTRKSFCSVA